MLAELRNRFRASFIMSDAPIPIASARDLLADVRSRPVWDGASISPADAEYPRVHVDWHEGHGFVFQCYEDEESWSDFLVTSRYFSLPSIEVELGGQALERWPRELFVPTELAAQALTRSNRSTLSTIRVECSQGTMATSSWRYHRRHAQTSTPVSSISRI